MGDREGNGDSDREGKIKRGDGDVYGRTAGRQVTELTKTREVVERLHGVEVKDAHTHM